MYQQRQKICVCNNISHDSMRKWDINSPRTSTCEDFLASTIAISDVRCYTVNSVSPKRGTLANSEGRDELRLFIRVCALFREKHYILEINKISKAEKNAYHNKTCLLLEHFRNIFLQIVYAQSDLGQYCLSLYGQQNYLTVDLGR